MDEGGNNVKHLVNIFRRLHRIFAHAWFQHTGVFWQVEGQTGLYVLFKTVCDLYDLLPAENYKLPPEAEGLEPANDVKLVPTILKADIDATNDARGSEADDPSYMGIGRTNTRRHIRSSPSTGSAVTTVLEAEEDDTDVTSRLGSMLLSDNQPQTTITPLTGSNLDTEAVSEEEITIEAEIEDEIAEETSPDKEAVPEIDSAEDLDPASAEVNLEPNFDLEMSDTTKSAEATENENPVNEQAEVNQTDKAEVEEPKSDKAEQPTSKEA